MRTSRLFLAVLLLGVGFLGSVADAREDPRRSQRIVLGAGTPWETVAWSRTAEAPGPTVLITAGVHGNEVASTYAADQIRQWPLRRGQLVVLPRANVQALTAFTRTTPGAGKALGNLNRNFPRAGKLEGARGPLAQGLWKFVRETNPDWLIDLHEGKDFHQVNAESVGSTVICTAQEDTHAAAAFMLDAVNVTIPAGKHRFVKLRMAVDGSLARAAAEHMDARAMILETTWKQPRSLRVRQHRLMVHRLLLHLGMIAHDLPVDRLVDRAAYAGQTIVGLYDAGGAGGRGIPNLWAQLRKRDDVHVVRIGPPEVRGGGLEGLDLVIFPGGTGSGQAKALAASGRAALKRFVSEGGGYIGICAGAYLACAGFSWGLELLDARTVSPKWKRGRATLQVELTERGREVLGDAKARFAILYNNGPVLAPAEDADLPDYETWAVFRTEVAKNGTPNGAQVGTPAVAAGRCGQGRVVAFSPHPEQTTGLAHIVDRAVDWVAGREP